MTTKLNGPCYASGNEVENLVVLLHGRGSSGDNMIAIAPRLSKLGLKNTQFIAPHAPRAYGPSGYTWFTDSLRDMKEETAFAEMMESVGVLSLLVDCQLEMFGLGDDRLSFVGFSQGAMLSMYVGLSRKNKCAGVVAYSGAVPFPQALEKNIVSRPDVCIVHGKNDDVIPFCYFGECVEFLRRNGATVEALGIDFLDHSINDQGMEFGAKFISDRVTKA